MSTQESRHTYFPPLYGDVDCRKCEQFGKCPACDRFQRDRRDFTVTSGRCPRLPDLRGLMDTEHQRLYESMFPVVYAHVSDGVLILRLHRPGDRVRKVYWSRSGYWYFRDKFEGEHVKRALTIQEGETKQRILDQMHVAWSNDIVLRCTVEDFFV